MLRGLRLAVLASCALLALGACGGDEDGGGGAAASEAAKFAPASSAIFVSIDTDFESEQWQRAEALLNKFPDGGELLSSIRKELDAEDVNFERDVKPALGPEVGVVAFDIQPDDPPAVFFTKPADRAKLDALVQKANDASDDEDLVTREIEGWVVAAETEQELDRFANAREGGESLADADEFNEALEATDPDAAVFVYGGGTGLAEAFNEGLREEGAPRALTERLSRFRSFSSSAAAEQNGIRFDEVFAYDGDLGLGSYAPELEEVLPAKPLVYLSIANLDEPARKLLDVVRDTVPNFNRGLGQIEAALGLSLENDVIALLDGESALAIYPTVGGELPVVVDYALAVDDEARARRIMERFGALLELGDSGTATKLKVAGLDATRLDFTDEGYSLFWAVFDGTLALSTEGERGLGELAGDESKLADDAAYAAAQQALDMPSEVTAVVYSDLRTAMPFFLDLAEQEGEDVDDKTRRNLEPLRSFVAYAVEEEPGLRVSGLVGVE